MKHAVRTFVAALLLASPTVFAQEKTADKPAVQPAKADPVKLVSAGAEPRRELRYAPAKGDSYGFEMRMKMNIKMTLNGKAAPSNVMPTMVMGGDVKVVDVASNGNITMSFVYGPGKLEGTDGVQPMIMDKMKEAVESTKGMSGQFVFTPRGEYVSGSFKIPDGVDPMAAEMIKGMNKSMEQFTVPLPAEAVGKGAKWTCVRVQDTSGLKINVDYTQELTAMTEKGFTAKTTIKGESKDQEMQGVHFHSLTMTGEGDQAIEFARVMPTECRISSVAASSAEAGGTQMDMDMTMTLNLKLTEPGKFTAPAKDQSKTAEPDKNKSAPKF